MSRRVADGGHGRKAAPDRRRAIIDTARRMFGTMPYDQVTTSEIAKQAGVAYGLVAHHFAHKRGLYLAVIEDLATEIGHVHSSAAQDDASPRDRLRHTVADHIAYIDTHADGFVTLMRGGLGTDAEHQGIVDALRTVGIGRILTAVGSAEPAPPVLRTALRGWVAFLDDMMIDRIEHRDIGADVLVELACDALIATLRTAARLDPTIRYGDDVIAALT